MKRAKQKIVLFIYLIGVIAVSRIIPHPPNFTPIIAMAVFMPYLTRDLYSAMMVPLLAMLISDIVIGWHSTMFWVYGSILLGTIVSYFTMPIKKTSTHVITNSILACLIFFVITNWAVWMSSTMYPNTLEGLLMCYTMAIPFFGNTLAGTAFYLCFLGSVSYSLTNVSRRYTKNEENITSSLNIICLLYTSPSPRDS